MAISVKQSASATENLEHTALAPYSHQRNTTPFTLTNEKIDDFGKPEHKYPYINSEVETTYMAAHQAAYLQLKSVNMSAGKYQDDKDITERIIHGVKVNCIALLSTSVHFKTLSKERKNNVMSHLDH